MQSKAERLEILKRHAYPFQKAGLPTCWDAEIAALEKALASKKPASKKTVKADESSED